MKNVRFLVKVVNRSIYTVMRICKMLISCIKLDHVLYSINYGNKDHILRHFFGGSLQRERERESFVAFMATIRIIWTIFAKNFHHFAQNENFHELQYTISYIILDNPHGLHSPLNHTHTSDFCSHVAHCP